MENKIKEIFRQLQKEGFDIELLDFSVESDEEVWVAYVINQSEEQINEMRDYLKETGCLIEPADDIIEPFEELYKSLKSICVHNNIR